MFGTRGTGARPAQYPGFHPSTSISAVIGENRGIDGPDGGHESGIYGPDGGHESGIDGRGDGRRPQGIGWLVSGSAQGAHRRALRICRSPLSHGRGSGSSSGQPQRTTV